MRERRIPIQLPVAIHDRLFTAKGSMSASAFIDELIKKSFAHVESMSGDVSRPATEENRYKK
jgi:hypothetical protein